MLDATTVFILIMMPKLPLLYHRGNCFHGNKSHSEYYSDGRKIEQTRYFGSEILAQLNQNYQV
jgi:hypothetical protein